MGQDGNFESCHFGDAHKYLIYQWNGKDINLIEEVINTEKATDETAEHNSPEKSMAITQLLKAANVDVLVSKQFGRNIKRINQHFIPIIIHKETPQEVLEVLLKHMRWIQDELENKPKEYKLFHIKTGILKTAINKAENL